MLHRLEIINIAIIEALTVEFESGLNAVTGETGSGKSLVLDALQSVFDKRLGTRELLRYGAAKGRVELTFGLAGMANRPDIETLLTESGIDPEPDSGDRTELILSREFTPSGSRCRINGTLVPMSVMERLGPLLLEIYGQHDLHTLFSAARQRQMLDNLGGEPLLAVRQQVRQLYREIQRVRNDLAVRSQTEGDRLREVDFLQFQLAEIDGAEIHEADEDTRLQAERERLAHADSLKKTALHAGHLLNGGDGYDAPSVFSLLGQVQKQLGQASDRDPQLQAVYDQVSEAVELLRGSNQALMVYDEQLDTSPERMQTIIDRLDTLEKLKRKYGGTLAAVLETRVKLDERLTELTRTETDCAAMAEQLAQLEADCETHCATLTQLRQKVAQALEAGITAELDSLMLPAARFAVQVTPAPLSETGQDSVMFLFSANPGEPLKPLAEVGSGGELSRLMLALKIHTVSTGEQTTLVLDEVDTGISGVTVRAMAEKLSLLQQQCQLITVTHQPILAARAIRHLHLSKLLEADRVSVQVTVLDNYDRRKAVLGQLASGSPMENAATDRFVEQLLLSKPG